MERKSVTIKLTPEQLARLKKLAANSGVQYEYEFYPMLLDAYERQSDPAAADAQRQELTDRLEQLQIAHDKLLESLQERNQELNQATLTIDELRQAAGEAADPPAGICLQLDDKADALLARCAAVAKLTPGQFLVDHILIPFIQAYPEAHVIVPVDFKKIYSEIYGK